MGKNYLESIKLIDRNNFYNPKEAFEVLSKISKAKFNETVELHVKLGVDPRHADQQVRGTVLLPNGTGKDVKILVFAKGDKAKEAVDAGADYVGDHELVNKIQNENWFDFDVIIATPDMMASLGKIGKVLGPKGLMPNPKTGTVTPTPERAVENVKKGMIEYRADSFGNIHCSVGKVSFEESALIENIQYVINAIVKAKPSTVKGKYIQNISLSTTMGPGIHVDQNSIDM